jgi:succinate-semialdehyde dehydrogenase/glutarate-semialdehyde dehydrogenase
MSDTIYAVVDPTTGQTVQTFDTIDDDALGGAIARAHAAHRQWGRGTSVSERAEKISAVAQLHTERRQELAQIIVREMGKPIAQALGEVDFSAAIYEYYADTAAALLADEPIELLEGEGSAFLRRSSLGVLLGIMPWNYPYYQVARFAGPNLALGNTILLKPAPQCPRSAYAIEAIFHDAGIPSDAYITVLATNDQIEWTIADHRVQGVSLTGSGRAGAAVAQLAGRHLKKVVLELGGSDPFLVLSADRLDEVVAAAVAGRLENTGQACNAAKRFIVLDTHYDAFLERFTAALTAVEPADPSDPATLIGPLSSSAAADQLEAQIDDAVANGATLVAGGGRAGNFVRTAVIGVLRPGRAGVQGRLRGGSGHVGQRHPLRPGLLCLHQRPAAGAPSRRSARRGHGLHQRGRCRRRRVALRRRQSVGFWSGAWPSGDG